MIKPEDLKEIQEMTPASAKKVAFLSEYGNAMVTLEKIKFKERFFQSRLSTKNGSADENARYLNDYKAQSDLQQDYINFLAVIISDEVEVKVQKV